ncbi:MAG: hypothetical protein LBV69_04200 [Bacteroidales bacterium]|jgi:hypothetical protein|nr:hypothetical protein [Bacteroidales bacterium]
MKKLLLILLFFAASSIYSLQAQTSHYVDPRLNQVFEQEYFSYLQTNAPQELIFLNWYLDNSYVIKEVGLEKCQNLPYLKYFDRTTKTVGNNVEDIDMGDLANFNVFLYDVSDGNNTSSYRIGDSGKVLIMLSNKMITEQFNNYISHEN